MAHPDQVALAKRFCSVWLLGPPMNDDVVEFVAHIFSPEEAAVALHLPMYRGGSLETIAGRVGRPADEVEPLLGAMTERSVIRRSRAGYSIIPLVPGMFEYVLMEGDASPWHRQYARMFEELFATGYAGAYTQARIPVVRNVPAIREVDVEQSVDTTSVIVDADLMEEMLQVHERFGVLNVCQCRQSRAFAGKSCRRADIEDGCLIFGGFAGSSIDRGKGRWVSREEMRDIVTQRRSKKLVFLAGNVAPEASNVICNCCDCCCHLLETISDFGGWNWVAPPRYLAEVTEDACDHCGLCRPACSTGAHAVVKKVHTYSSDQCIGCGNCVDVCRTDAIRLVANPRYKRAPQDFGKLLKRVAPGIGWTLLKARLGR